MSPSTAFLRLFLVFPLAMSAVACVGIGGEKVSLGYGDLPSVSAGPPMDVSLNHVAIDERRKKVRIGRATVTVFAITSGSVVTEGEIEQEIVMLIKSLLEDSGYRVQLVNQEWEYATQPMLTVSIEQSKFTNYNYLFPIVPTWGGFELALTITDERGIRVFKESYTGRGNSFKLVGHDAFEEATTEALAEIASKMQATFATEQFRQLVQWKAADFEDTASSTPAVSSPPPSASP